MTPFLYNTANYIHQHFGDDTRKLLLVLPNKRGSLFLKRHLANIYNKTIWLPKIISAEELITELSGLQTADNITLVAVLYDCYRDVMKDKAESFDNFLKWSNMLLQDFNEIDRYLIDAQSIYKNLTEIKEIENWSLAAEEKTEMQSNYIKFMSSLGDIYALYTQKLIAQNIAYQGLAYKKAVEALKTKSAFAEYDSFIFAGFNALNRAEEIIFQHFIEEKKAAILWDADEYYLHNEKHEAGLFLRKHLQREHFKTDSFIENNYLEGTKNIEIIGAAQNMAQVSCAAQILQNWIHSGVDLNKTAIVLCDETLLFPLLSVLPEEIKEVNVSLEYPLSKSTLYDLASQLVNLHINKKQSRSGGAIYYKDLLKVIQNPYFSMLLGDSKNLQIITRSIAENNITYFSVSTLEKIIGENYTKVNYLFAGWESISGVIKNLRLLANNLISLLNSENKQHKNLETEFIVEFSKLITNLETLVEKVNYITELKTLRKIIQQLLSGASVPFFGEPLKGLQIMGVLETRTLDFENVILISVNENILPSGKSSNTFIPYDLKKYFKLPVYQDKDAIYAYHFYRLLQKAKNIGLIYNTENDTFGKGEKSRFITQLVNELPAANKAVNIVERIAVSEDLLHKDEIAFTIEKTEEHIIKTKDKAFTHERPGFSPSLLNNYRDCSLRFYFNYISKIREADEVEENVETNTMGTILHEVLEQIYTPFKDSFVKKDALLAQLTQLETLTETAFKNHFSESEFKFGKNFLAFQTVQLYATSLIKSEAEKVERLEKQNDSLKIIDLERKLESIIELKQGDEIIPIKVIGISDRIDASAGQFRIVDYKSSVSQKDSFVFTNFEELFADKKYNKAFQLFIYAWLCWKNKLSVAEHIKPCIIPFRSNDKNEYYITQKIGKETCELQFTDSLLMEFEIHLTALLGKVFDKATPYTQTEDEDKCQFCAYAPLCRR